MSRRSIRSQPTVALFPFLAVLLCTMGSLILLLLLVARQARAQAEEERRAAEAKLDRAAVEAERDQQQWRVDQLARSRDKTLADLGEARSLLSHLEEHMLRLRTEIAEAETALRLLEGRAALDDAQRVRQKQDLVDLRRRIAELEAKLKEAEKAGKRPQAFAVVPFEGQGATRRRPIYIECRADSIVLQPEGVVFHESDFTGSLSPANPLASAVRAASEHIARTSRLTTAEQPYPLLIVRPSGIPAYYAARAAMSSWDSEFGYELVNEDWPLEYPPADPQRTQLVTQAVEEARLRQTLIARAAPTMRQRASNATFGVSRTGHGIERLDDGETAEAGFGGGARSPSGTDARNGGTRRLGGFGGFGADDDRGGGGGGNVAGGPSGPAPGSAGGAVGRGYGGADARSSQVAQAGGFNPAGGPMLGGPGGDAASGLAGGYGSGGPGSGGDGARPGGSAPGGSTSGQGNARYNADAVGTGSGRSPNGVAGGSASQGNGTRDGSGSSGTSTGGNGGEGSSSGTFSGGTSGGGSAGGGSSGDPDIAAAQSPNVSLMNDDRSQVESLAHQRGKDWGLPNKSPNATGLTRPIQIYCAADRITIFSDRGAGEQIMIAGRTEEAVDELIANVWSQVDTWGLAGRGMYWKPVLSMHVAPDGVRRYTELRTLLDGSGLEVTGKPLTVAAPGPRLR